MSFSYAKYIHPIPTAPKVFIHFSINSKSKISSKYQLNQVGWTWDMWGKIPLQLWACESTQVTYFQNTILGQAHNRYSHSKMEKWEIRNGGEVPNKSKTQQCTFRYILRLKNNPLCSVLQPSEMEASPSSVVVPSTLNPVCGASDCMVVVAALPIPNHLLLISQTTHVHSQIAPLTCRVWQDSLHFILSGPSVQAGSVSAGITPSLFRWDGLMDS